MINKKSKNTKIVYFVIITLVLALYLLTTEISFGQTAPVAQRDTVNSTAQSLKTEVSAPVFKEYRGITIGMSADQVRDNIDKKPMVADKSGFYYVFSDDESAQIELDSEDKVKVISITYSGESSETPKFEDVFGKGTPISEATDGKIYKQVNYPEADLWIAYSRSGGEESTVSITIQKSLY